MNARAAEGGAGEVTRLIAAARAGDAEAPERLFTLVYDDLRELAKRHVRPARSAEGHGATSVVHELFLRIARRGELAVQDRTHFFALASRAMRQIVLDDVRARHRDKRGGGRADAALDDAVLATVAAPARATSSEELLTLDGALDELAGREPELAELVEWHYFGGLTFGEIAEARGVSERTVYRDWRAARAFLNAALEPSGE